MLSVHFCVWALLISIHDWRFHRIRRKDVLLAIVSLLPWIHFESIKVAIFNLSIYLLVFILSRGQIGFGDVRLSLLIGFYLGLQEVSYLKVLEVNFLSWLGASLFAIGRWVCRFPIGALPFAPFMFLSVVISAVIDTAKVI